MRLIMIAGAAVFVLAATAAMAQEQSPPSNTVGSGTAKALEPGAHGMVGKPVSPSTAGSDGVSQRRKAIEMPQPGSVPQKGAERPSGTTGAPPYGSSAPKPSSSPGANDEPHGG